MHDVTIWMISRFFFSSFSYVNLFMWKVFQRQNDEATFGYVFKELSFWRKKLLLKKNIQKKKQSPWLTLGLYETAQSSQTHLLHSLITKDCECWMPAMLCPQRLPWVDLSFPSNQGHFGPWPCVLPFPQTHRSCDIHSECYWADMPGKWSVFKWWEWRETSSKNRNINRCNVEK